MARIVDSPFSHIDKEVGGRIRARRRVLGLSQTVLAERIGVTYQQLQKYENGKNRIGSSRLQAIAQALGTTPAELFGNIGARGGAVPEFDQINQFVGWAEGLALNRAFARINDDKVRRSILGLITSLSKDGAAQT
ncbi:hypothetical protein ASE04_22145 [Rhizobium sp. Root708]|uniref:helix-turn-helix domain-containing protein n=1 Tax=Rhizobium sp. Root708 TaxID=1736592 RepID=UPI0006FEF732|nr:helix-turn-helix transcriptional regulator [Rhizobium sp. Root708]KRB61555.1 hypothetical protein ASE04_22145 [Rhizobium sp. Root708]